MHISKFIQHLKKNECELIPMPEWHSASTLKILHRRKGLTAYLNTSYEELWGNTIEGICTRLGIPFPDNYHE